MDVDATLEGLQQYMIHNTRYFRVFYSHADDPETVLQCQLPFDAFDERLKPGDPITVTYLLRTVMKISARS
jgi:hypothetical protein